MYRYGDYMEVVQDTIDDIEVYETEIDMYIKLFCEENNISCINDISQSVYNAMLRYVYKHCFRGTDKLKSKRLYATSDRIKSNYNAYDIDICDSICDHYIYLCQLYDKEISIVGYSNLTGIDNETVLVWGSGDRKTLSSKSIGIYQKLVSGRENSLSDKLSSGKGNPVGILAILNHCYNWAGVGNMEERKPQQISLSDVRQSVAKLSDNSGQAVAQIAENSNNKLSDN